MDKETYRKNKRFAGEKKPSMKRRLVGHDYTRRGIYLLTMAVEGRRPLFGRVYGSSDDARIELSELGCAVRDEWFNIPNYHPEVKPLDLQMMPDHLHGIIYISEPLAQGLSGVVRGFKTGCGRAYRRLVVSSSSVATGSDKPQVEAIPNTGYSLNPATTTFYSATARNTSGGSIICATTPAAC